ncbi:cyclin-dependent kinases regulatory subunit 1-like [Sturnira hondurensis]|uniref:cyclin-dependent kinases regulatory subunit 1-like n=1 Tax=Sturnira hondurensis TaxID=192404 RepID=UPI00187A5753|nr:cyclin-dependent kinases regulatory subunit 1-like [Sturnira hondurensis]
MRWIKNERITSESNDPSPSPDYPAKGFQYQKGWQCGAAPLWSVLRQSGHDAQIYYSDKYDEEFEYQHLMLPKVIAKLVPKTHLMSKSEWRNLIQQSQGWVHYMIHEPQPHILLLQQPLPKKPKE